MPRSGRNNAIAIGGVALLLSLGGMALAPRVALAHEVGTVTPERIWRLWNWDATILLGLTLSAWLYWRGVRTLWRRAGVGRGLAVWRAAAFGAGLATLFVALISPVDALGHALFAAHMVQHLLLILVAAPLLLMGRPHVAFQWALPLEGRREVGQWWRRNRRLRAAWGGLAHPLTAWTLHSIALWIWHAPFFYEAAIVSPFVHAIEHICFFATALLFWWSVGRVRDQRLGHAVGIFFVFTMMMQSGVLGALMTFAPTPWYPVHAASAAAWGLTPLDDQHLAGLIMWAPAGAFYLAAALALFAAWLRAAERQARSNERGGAEPTRLVVPTEIPAARR